MISAVDAVEVLNRALKEDREAITRLFLHREPCNEALANDVTIQVRGYPVGAQTSVSALGLINGLFGIRRDGQGWISAMVDDDGRITSFLSTPDSAAPTS